jgi:ADP-heptose:LPS heptosyltransferase
MFPKYCIYDSVFCFMAKSGNIVFFYKQLGDVLLLGPALQRLGKDSAQNVTYISKPEFQPMLELMPGIAVGKWKPFQEFEKAWIYDLSFKSAMRSFFTLTEKKTLFVKNGKNLRWFHIPFQKIEMPRSGGIYRAKFYWDATPGSEHDRFEPPKLNAPPESWLPSELQNKQFILVHPTSAWKRKTWLAERWANIILRLHEENEASIVLTGGRSEWERQYCHEIRKQISMPIIDFSGRTTLQQLLAIVHKSKEVFTIDGAVSHIAAAYQKPCITLFGPTDHRSWHFPTDYSIALSAADMTGNRNADLSPIQVGDVLEVIKKLRAAYVG